MTTLILHHYYTTTLKKIELKFIRQKSYLPNGPPELKDESNTLLNIFTTTSKKRKHNNNNTMRESDNRK